MLELGVAILQVFRGQRLPERSKLRWPRSITALICTELHALITNKTSCCHLLNSFYLQTSFFRLRSLHLGLKTKKEKTRVRRFAKID